VLVAVDCLAVVFEVVVGVAETVPGVSLVVARSKLLEPVQRLFAVQEGFGVSAEEGFAPAGEVEGERLAVSVPGVLKQCQGLPAVGERLGGAAPPFEQG